MTGVGIAVLAIVVAIAFGLYRRVTDGRFGTRRLRSERSEPRNPLADRDPTWHELPLGERATLVQFSSAFCAPCRTTRVVLADVAEHESGVVHHDIDAEKELALVRELGITRTPTTLILDRDGTEIARASGAPRKEQVLAVLPPR